MADRCSDHRTRRFSGSGGFTLLETIAVMVLIAVLAAVAVVSMASTTANRASIAARALQRDLAYARQRAMATGLRTWVFFDTGAETWDVREEDAAAPGKAGATTLTDPADGAPMIETLGSGTSIGVGITSAVFDGDDEIGFDWLGQPLNSAESALAADGTVTLTDNHLVHVLARSGHVTYVEP